VIREVVLGRSGVGSLVFLAGALALCASCAVREPAPSSSPPQAPPVKVKIGRELPNVACRDLGPIKGSRASTDWAAADPKEQDTYGQLTSSTRGLGGDHALIRAVAKDAHGITVTATAYDCSGHAPPTQALAEAPPPVKPVKVGRDLPHPGCRELGQIWGTGRTYWPSSEKRMQGAYDELMASTRSVGGDYALIDAVGSDSMGITISGHAYDCSAPPPAEADAPVVVVPASEAKPAATVEERLRRLEELKAKGLITPEEYATRRRAIVDGL
jgi:putative oligomerization/nucleic acid binding protein